ncbi:DUF3667 domain-containing protein [Mesonia sp.]|uniref:DUF3667 domain-containing protein n=1 Tax=Mesonia sp. TaxID=1960830 RepID=UPI00175499AF|nr:DUF3667 domain-containing protein [Mesonia sp.]HIB38233.1 DUF3667 domain-containing protein [Mesonia sp.]HIO26544.1 DUF3667 domain-containing protein [Flavobacteriaceae bacterium]
MERSRFAKRYRGHHCLNCETPLEIEDKYCSYCGQLNSNKKLSFNDFFNEFFGSIFSYDSRIYRTLNILIFKPGKISLEYIKGKRVKYANPFRFYLSISIIFFLLYGFSLSENEERTFINFNDDKTTTIEDFKKVKLLSETELDSFNFAKRSTKKIEIYLAFDKLNPDKNISTSLKELKHNNTFYNRWLFKRAIAIDRVMAEPGSFGNYTLGKLPFIIFFFIPVFTLILWLTFGRTNYNYMEHLVFAFYTQTMLFFLMSFSVILYIFFSSNWLTALFILSYGFYLFNALRNFYKQGFLKTLFKFVFLNVIFVILATITTGLAIMASFAVY